MALAVRAILAFLLGLTASAASAGPPYATDDPAPTDTGHWEIFNFVAGTAGRGTLDGAAGVDINYGVVPDIQLTATVPIDFERDQGSRAAFGDVEIGVKYRFLEAGDVSAAVFPRVILPTAGRGLGTGRTDLLLPVWAQWDSGPWSLFGGGGYTINPGAGNRDFWQEGVALTRTVSPRLSLGAEITHEGADETGGHAGTALGAGAVYRLGGPFALLVSAGPAFTRHRAGADWNFYTALGLDF